MISRQYMIDKIVQMNNKVKRKKLDKLSFNKVLRKYNLEKENEKKRVQDNKGQGEK